MECEATIEEVDVRTASLGTAIVEVKVEVKSCSRAFRLDMWYGKIIVIVFKRLSTSSITCGSIIVFDGTL